MTNKYFNPDELDIKEFSKNEFIDIGKTLYNECGTHIRYMLEWRHKLLLRFFVTIASFLLVVRWMWESKNENIYPLIFIPLFLSALSAAVFFIMDRRNMKVVNVCSNTGRGIEQKIFKYDDGLYANMRDKIRSTRDFFSYTWMITFIYCGTTTLFLFGSIIAFIKYHGWTIYNILVN